MENSQEIQHDWIFRRDSWLEQEQVSLHVDDSKASIHPWFRCKTCGQDHVYYSDHIKTRNAIKQMQRKP